MNYLKSINNFYAKHLLLCNTVSSAMIMTSGDLIIQKINTPGAHDWDRTCEQLHTALYYTHFLFFDFQLSFFKQVKWDLWELFWVQWNMCFIKTQIFGFHKKLARLSAKKFSSIKLSAPQCSSVRFSFCVMLGKRNLKKALSTK